MADGEADELCAKMVIENKAYACLSEDMDLFVYGCPRILRYLSLISETFIIYYFDKILMELDMTKENFQMICIISGTDYNININSNINLFKTLNYYNLFKKYNYNDFYDWLLKHTIYLQNYDSINLFKSLNIFSLNNFVLKNYDFLNTNNSMDKQKIQRLMIPEGFYLS